jgi:hypothetical protein
VVLLTKAVVLSNNIESGGYVLGANGAVKSATHVISDTAPKVVHGAGQIAKSTLVKLKLIEPESNKRRTGEIVITVAAVGLIVRSIFRSIFKPKDN